MAGKNVIKSFLVSLGYQVDENSKKKYDEALGTATRRAAALGAAVAAAAFAVERAATSMARDLEKVYWQSRRTKQSAENVEAFAYAVGQLGGTAEGARASLRSISDYLRYNPGGASWLRSLGVDPLRVMNGQLDQLASRWRRLDAESPGKRAQAHFEAQAMGVDEETYRAMLEGTGEFERKQREVYQRLGVDQQMAAKAGRDYMVVWREARLALGAAASKIAVELLPAVREVSARFGALVSDPERVKRFAARLTELLVGIRDVAVWISAHVVPVFEWLWGLLEKLDRATGGWSTTILAVLAALKYLGLAGLALSPLGAAIVGVGAAILALAGDYEKWRASGGKDGLINWSEWEKQIGEMRAGVASIRGSIGSFFKWLSTPGTVGNGVGNFLKTQITDHLHRVLDVLGMIVSLLSGNWRKAWEDAADSVARSPIGKLFGLARPTLERLNPSSPENVERRQRIAAGEDVDRQMIEGASGKSPRGIRNNNPGNVRFGEFAKRYGATGADADGFAVFPSMRSGVAATSGLLTQYAASGVNTVSKIIGKYAPPGENNTEGYAKFAAKQLGVGRDVELNAAQVQQLTKAIFSMEVGSAWARRIEGIDQARLGAGGAGAAQVSMVQNNTFNTTGTDAKAISENVLDGVKRQSSVLAANTRSRLR